MRGQLTEGKLSKLMRGQFTGRLSKLMRGQLTGREVIKVNEGSADREGGYQS